MSLHHLLNNCDTPQKIVKNINQQLKVARFECHLYMLYHYQCKITFDVFQLDYRHQETILPQNFDNWI